MEKQKRGKFLTIILVVIAILLLLLIIYLAKNEKNPVINRDMLCNNSTTEVKILG